MTDPTTILVVDDDPDQRFLLEEAWNDVPSPWTMVTAGDGLAALRALDRADAPPAFVVLDLDMPRLDGLETLARIRARPGGEDLTVVLYTSSDSPANRARAAALGATLEPKRDDLDDLTALLARVARGVSC